MKRSRRRTPLMAAAGASLLVMLLGAGYLLSAGILYPRRVGIAPIDRTAATVERVVSAGRLTTSNATEISIDVDNVKQVVATLARPTRYRQQINNTLYYAGGSTTLHCEQTCLVGLMRIDRLSAAGAVESTLVRAGERAYAWRAASDTVYEGSWGAFSEDALAMLPSYEDVLQDTAKVEHASLQTIAGEPCIVVTYAVHEFVRTDTISTITGLLTRAVFTEGEQVVREVQVQPVVPTTPLTDTIILPNGVTLGQ